MRKDASRRHSVRVLYGGKSRLSVAERKAANWPLKGGMTTSHGTWGSKRGNDHSTRITGWWHGMYCKCQVLGKGKGWEKRAKKKGVILNLTRGHCLCDCRCICNLHYSLMRPDVRHILSIRGAIDRGFPNVACPLFELATSHVPILEILK